MRRTRVAIYIRRMSTEILGNGCTDWLCEVIADCQQTLCRRYADGQGWRVAGVWTDALFADAEFDRMLTRAAEWDAVLVFRHDRIDGHEDEYDRRIARVTDLDKQVWSLEELRVRERIERYNAMTVEDFLQARIELEDPATLEEAREWHANKDVDDLARRNARHLDVELWVAVTEAALKTVPREAIALHPRAGRQR